MQACGRAHQRRGGGTLHGSGKLILVVFGKGLIGLRLRQRAGRLLGKPGKRGAAVEADVGLALDVAYRKRRCARRIVTQLRHGDDGKFQALRRVDGHDAHEVAAARGKRSRSLARHFHATGQPIRHASRPHAALRLDFARHADDLVHVGRTGKPFGTGGLQPRKPPGCGHHVLEDAREGDAGQLILRPAHDQRRVAQGPRHLASRRDRLLQATESLVERTTAKYSQVGVAARRQHEQIVGGEREQLARYHLEQRRRPFRVRDGLRQAHHERNLGRAIEYGAPGDHASQAVRTQRLGIHVGARHATEQHNHVPGRHPLARKRGELVGNAARRRSNSLIGRNALVRLAGHLHTHAGALRAKRPRHASLVATRRKRHELRPEHPGLLENAVAQRQHVAMAAEVVRQLDQAIGVALFDIGQVTAIHRHVGPAEPVDALLRVTDRAQARKALPCQALDHVDLQLVGILELIDHHQLEAVLVGARDGGAIEERLVRQGEKVVIAQKPRRALAPLKRRQRQARQIDERVEQRRGPGTPGFGANAEQLVRQIGGLLPVRHLLAETKPRDREGVQQLEQFFVRKGLGRGLVLQDIPRPLDGLAGGVEEVIAP